MPSYTYSVTEHDPDRPWMVVGSTERYEIELETSEDFFKWANRTWPAPRFSVQLDPWQLQQPGVDR